MLASALVPTPRRARRRRAAVDLGAYLEIRARGLTHLVLDLAAHRAPDAPLPFDDLRDVLEAPHSLTR